MTRDNTPCRPVPTKYTVWMRRLRLHPRGRVLSGTHNDVRRTAPSSTGGDLRDLSPTSRSTFGTSRQHGILAVQARLPQILHALAPRLPTCPSFRPGQHPRWHAPVTSRAPDTPRPRMQINVPADDALAYAMHCTVGNPLRLGFRQIMLSSLEAAWCSISVEFHSSRCAFNDSERVTARASASWMLKASTPDYRPYSPRRDTSREIKHNYLALGHRRWLHPRLGRTVNRLYTEPA